MGSSVYVRDFKLRFYDSRMSSVFAASVTSDSNIRAEEEKEGMKTRPQLNLIVRGQKVPCSGAHFLLDAVPSIQTDKTEIRLPDEIDVGALLSVVRYLGEGQMDGVGAHNAAKILDCAKLFNLKEVRDACEETLLRSLSTDNCVQLRQLATQHSLPRLSDRCDGVLHDDLPAVLRSRGLLQLPRIQVQLDVSSQLLEFGTDLLEKVVPKTLLALDSLNRSRQDLEEAVVQLILLPDLRVSEWTEETRAQLIQAQYSPEKRRGEMLAKVRNGRSPARQLILGVSECKGREEQLGNMQPIATTKLSDTSSACLVELQRSLTLITVSLCTVLQNGHLPASPTTGLHTFSQSSGCFISHMSTARSGFGVVATESEILAIGGFNRDGCLDSSERYNSLTNSWKEVGKMGARRGRFAMVKIDSTVYAIGGCDGRRELSSVEVLNAKSCDWHKMHSRMPTPRSCHGAAELDGVVYAVGGVHYSVPLKTAEALDPATGVWQSVPPLLTPRMDLAMAACGGKVYAIGGKASGLQCLSSVECYDPAQKVWSPVASMKHPRRNAATVVLDEKIMVIGGYNGTTVLQSVELYDPQTNTWAECAPICTGRSHASATVYDDKVYVLGGYSGSVFLNSVECYDQTTRQWTPFV